MGTSNSQQRMDRGDHSSAANDRNNRLINIVQQELLMLRRSARSADRLQRSNISLRGTSAEPDNPWEDNDVEYKTGTSLPKNAKEPDTEVLEKSEFFLITKRECGLKATKNSEYERPPAVVKMVAQREMGLKGGCGFSAHDLCNAMYHFLPNEMTVEDKYHYKAFCGTYSQDGNCFLSACQDRNLRLYRTTGKRFSLMRKIAARDVGWSILDTAFSPDGSCCVYSSWSESIYLVRLFGDSDCQDTLQLHPSHRRFCIFSLVFSHDGQEILCGANDGHLYVYDRISNQRILKINGHQADVNTVAYADNTSHILYSGGDDGLCKVWDRRTLSERDPKPVGILAGHMDGITFIEPRGDGRHFLSNSKDQTIKLWDVRVFSSEEGQEETRRAVADQQWDYRWQKVPNHLKQPQPKLIGDTSVMTYRGHSVLQTLIRCHFSPAVSTGQRYIYTGCAQGRIFIYDALTGQAVRVLHGHEACVRDVSWHPFKPELTSTSWDSVVARWRHKNVDDSSDEDSEALLEKWDLSDSSSSSSSNCIRRSVRRGSQRNPSNSTNQGTEMI